MSTMPGGNVLADNPRDIAGDTTGAIGELANGSFFCGGKLVPKLTIHHAPADCVHLQYATTDLP